MATKLFLRNTTTNNISGYYDMVTTAGSDLDTGVVNSTAGGTEIQWTKTAGGTAMAWISGRVPAGGFTLTSTDISIWAIESASTVNAGGRYRVFKYSGGSETELGGGPFNDGVEFSYMAQTEMIWVGNVTDTAFAENDRIVIKLYITNVGTMGAGTCTLNFNAADAATGDSFFNIAETVAFKIEDTAPTVTTSLCTSVTINSAAGNGNITSTGGVNPTRRGFCYKVGTAGDPTIADSIVYEDGSYSTGSYSLSITGLTLYTSYRVRAYATNSVGTSYGSTVQLVIGADKSRYYTGIDADGGRLPCGDDSSISLTTFKQFQVMLRKSVVAGSLVSNPIVSTYSLVYTTATGAYAGGVLSSNGDIHFVPNSANRGQKIDINGVVSTYSLVYTNASGAYRGGVLAPNGDIHFVPHYADRGQKIDINGVVSTYSLVYTNISGAYFGGVLAPNGDIHFIPNSANRGQKIDINGVVSTYSLVYTSTVAYTGGVLAPNGDIHFVPRSADRGQKINSAGVVSTYSLVYTNISGAYFGGVLAPNGDIHFVPYYANRGQKVDVNGVVSTYSLVYTGSAYFGGVLAPNGDIHFVPYYADRGQKIDKNGVVSTYSLVYTGTAHSGAVLAPNGDIHFFPYGADRGQKISTMPAIPFSLGVCCSPFFNKL